MFITWLFNCLLSSKILFTGKPVDKVARLPTVPELKLNFLEGINDIEPIMFITRLFLFMKKETSPQLIIINPLRPFLLCAKYFKNWSINVGYHLLRISSYLVVHNLFFKAIKTQRMLHLNLWITLLMIITVLLHFFILFKGIWHGKP